MPGTTLAELKPALDKMLARLSLGESHIEGDGEGAALYIQTVSISEGERVPVNTIGGRMTAQGSPRPLRDR